jgi:pilus assembly protein CpaB
MRRRRPPASRVLMVLSILLAAIATLVLRGHLARVEARAGAAGPGRSVVVADVPLERGATIDPSDLSMGRIPERYLPPGALADPGEAAGRMLAADVAAGEPITTTRLAAGGGPVASLIPAGLRAVPLAVALPGGAVESGDRVDVLATFSEGQPHTETVVTGAEVLAVLEASEVDDFGAATTLVVLVGPDDAERLAYARAFADLAVAIAPPAS